MFFGTDGIRGEVVSSPGDDQLAIEDYLERRAISSRLLKLVGEALTRTVEFGSNVIIGWDERPGNPDLVAGITQGLHLGGCSVTHAGICATPGLHNALLETGAALGCMITASHNPVTDSGIKVFDTDGFKSSPKYEDEISSLMIELAAEEREVDDSDLTLLSEPDYSFNANHAHQELLVVRLAEFSGMFAPPASQSLLLDCSKGAGSTWLADLLKLAGIDAEEVSQNAPALNDGCGAGELSPTDTWTWPEAARSDHILIHSLSRCAPGQIIAAALDGDGDRCLFIVSTEDGCAVLDGDGMADEILRSAKGKWHLAASIESDLSLISSLDRLEADVKWSQTAVGDRWLSAELRDSDRNVLGVEDSGHLVMTAPHPKGGRTLVGDGAASMIAVLAAMAVDEKSEAFIRGHKRRVSIKETDRSRWTGSNELADQIEHIAHIALGELSRHGLVGEANLMMLETDGLSIGIRNSGTQAKTNVSLRLAPGVDPTIPESVLNRIVARLTEALVE